MTNQPACFKRLSWPRRGYRVYDGPNHYLGTIERFGRRWLWSTITGVEGLSITRALAIRALRDRADPGAPKRGIP